MLPTPVAQLISTGLERSYSASQPDHHKAETCQALFLQDSDLASQMLEGVMITVEEAADPIGRRKREIILELLETKGTRQPAAVGTSSQ